MPGMLVGRILRSPHAHARIRSIDTSKAAALPGVKAVITSADFPEQKFEYVGPERVAQNFWHMTRNIMAREKVLYEGHSIAAVAAVSKAIADWRIEVTRGEKDAFGSYFMSHPAGASVLDARRRIRLEIPSDASPAQIAADLRILLQES